MISVPTEAALEVMLEDHLTQCHAEPAHVPATQGYLKSMTRKALRRSKCVQHTFFKATEELLHDV